MSLFHALIFGVVEGVSEFLPISSTGHLILTAKLLGLNQSAFLKSFEIVIQLGAILSVIVLYGKSFLMDLRIVKRVACAFLPTAIIGFILYKLVKKYLMSSDVVIWTLTIGGIILVIFELCHKKENEKTNDLKKITYGQAFLIGLCQAIAIIPGVSRSAATIIGGLFLGLGRKTIVEF